MRHCAGRVIGPGVAAALTALMLLQAGIVCSVCAPGHSLWLAAGIGALAAGATVFAQREDARGLILFGGALAAVQLCDPLGVLLAAGMLPSAAMFGHPPRDARKAAGLYSLLFFAPVLTAASMFYLADMRHIAIAYPAATAAASLPHHDLAGRLALALLPLGIAAPGLAFARRGPGARAILSLAAATLLAEVVGAVMGANREPLMLISAAAPLSAGGLAVRARAAPRSGRDALLASAVAVLLSWGALALLRG